MGQVLPSRTVPVVEPAGRQRLRRRRSLAAIAMALVAAAWVCGYVTSGSDIAPLVGGVLPGSSTIEARGSIFVGRSAGGTLVGYAAVGSAPGYGGPIDMLVGVSPSGEILGTRVVAQRESPGFFRRFGREGFFRQYAGAPITRTLRLGDDLDGLSGATLSAEGIAAGVRHAVRVIAQEGLHAPLPPERKRLQWGVPEIVLLLLFAAGYVGHRIERRSMKRAVRWGTMLTGMVVLGFVYTAPLTIAQIVVLVSGYWPDWHNNLYWYLLVGGVLFVTVADSKNPYCAWFCPFGAFQECVGAVTRAPVYRPRGLHEALKWAQRGLALTAVLLGLALRRPGISTYEPYATLFDLTGTGPQWALLVIITLSSLIIYRPFCSYLCPIDPVVDLVGEGRRWLREEWNAWRAAVGNR